MLPWKKSSRWGAIASLLACLLGACSSDGVSPEPLADGTLVLTSVNGAVVPADDGPIAPRFPDQEPTTCRRVITSGSLLISAAGQAFRLSTEVRNSCVPDSVLETSVTSGSVVRSGRELSFRATGMPGEVLEYSGRVDEGGSVAVLISARTFVYARQ